MYGTSRRNRIDNIWKCLEWIIYFCLMATAILFAREVIEKFFGQNTGIKQNMERIKSHPTITICPFLQRPCANPSWIGDGYCDDETNNEICVWDGGDCCGDNVNTNYCNDCNCDKGDAPGQEYNGKFFQ